MNIRQSKILKFQNVMTLPTLVLLTLLTVFPILYTLGYSFTDYYYLAKDKPELIGIKNYAKILSDDVFVRATLNTFKFMVVAVTIETLLGLFMALLIIDLKKIGKVLRVFFLLPTLLPPVTVALLWQMMFSNNRGILNQLLGYVHLGPYNWLLDVNLAMPSIILIDIWQWTPFAFLLIYAALQVVPEAQYEAAAIDGVSGIKKFLFITMPNISQTLVMVILLRTIDTFRLFDKVNILTKGGPANTTTTITQYIYQKGIYSMKIGYGSAVSIIMVVMILLLSSVYIRKAFGDKK